jgi:hypothetical protein
MADDLQSRAIDIIGRRSEAETFVFRTVGMKSMDDSPDWHPLPHHCHDNVRAWVSRSPQHKHVFGYLLFGPLLGVWIVQAHSLVQFEDGSLNDITPSGASQTYPFVRHVGTEEEFADFAVAERVVVPVDVI